MGDLILGVKADGGGYQEVTAGGYDRATEAGQMRSFGPATADWGVIRAFGVVDGGGIRWHPLARPVVVAAGQSATLDLITGALSTTPAPGDAPERRVEVTAVPQPGRITGR